MTVSELINMLARYPGNYHVVHSIFPYFEDTADTDFEIMSPEAYKKGVENGDIE